MKKIYCFLLILGIFINNFPAVASAEVQTKTEEQLVVEALTNVRISDDTELVTRGEFCKIVYEIDNVDAPEATVDVFADVDMQDEYAGYIQNIYERGFVSGDRRKVSLSCTEKARPIIEDGLAVQTSFYKRITSGITEEDWEAYKRINKRVMENTMEILKT